ncbi:MAG: MBL fold metallo-hydrolase [Clostridia bacterium]|nr:MBL fold metallo-hydrolase [Clostridia bacterium]
MLNFIGIGSAFNTALGNNSAFIKEKDSILILDCGGSVFGRLMELNLLEKVQNVYILITHTHPDHVGSLGELLFYSYYALGQKPTVFFPNGDILMKLLQIMGVGNEMYQVESKKSFLLKDPSIGEMEIEFVATSHTDLIPSYAIILKSGGRSIYYSGDSNQISESILERLENGEIEVVYQDTCGLDYEGNLHLSLRRLKEIVKPHLRKKVFCMHLDNFFKKDEARENGFQVVEIYR